MNATISNFIGVYKEALPTKLCDDLVEYFESLHELGLSSPRQSYGSSQSKIAVDDTTVFMLKESTLNLQSTEFIKSITEVLWSHCYPHYVNNFAAITTSDHHNTYGFKLQKTEVGGGYHVWHYESATRAACNRLLVWMAYLNDVEEGGETEFLYYGVRIKPKKGDILIWPAAFTHTHRGNPPLSNSKYIVTGWFEF